MPDIELRARKPGPVRDPYGTMFWVFLRGSPQGSLVPIPEDREGNRWEAIDLQGNATRWRNRDQARDHLCFKVLPPG